MWTAESQDDKLFSDKISSYNSVLKVVIGQLIVFGREGALLHLMKTNDRVLHLILADLCCPLLDNTEI